MKISKNCIVNADSDALKKAVAQMRYRTYIEVNYADPILNDEYMDSYDDAKNSSLYL